MSIEVLCDKVYKITAGKNIRLLNTRGILK